MKARSRRSHRPPPPAQHAPPPSTATTLALYLAQSSCSPRSCSPGCLPTARCKHLDGMKNASEDPPDFCARHPSTGPECQRSQHACGRGAVLGENCRQFKTPKSCSGWGRTLGGAGRAGGAILPVQGGDAGGHVRARGGEGLPPHQPRRRQHLPVAPDHLHHPDCMRRSALRTDSLWKGSLRWLKIRDRSSSCLAQGAQLLCCSVCHLSRAASSALRSSL